MLFSHLKEALLLNASGYEFDSITESMDPHADSEKRETVTLTRQGYNVEISYDGTVSDFSRKLNSLYKHFNPEKCAEEIEKEKEINHDAAIREAEDRKRALSGLVSALTYSEDVEEQKICDKNKCGFYRYRYGYICVKMDYNGMAAVDFTDNPPGIYNLLAHGYVRIKGKHPTKEKLDTLFGNLNGKPIEEALNALKIFAEVTANVYNETYIHKDWREEKEWIARMSPEEREQFNLELEAENELCETEEAKKQFEKYRETGDYREFLDWKYAEIQKIVAEKIKAKAEAEEADGEDGGNSGESSWAGYCNW